MSLRSRRARFFALSFLPGLAVVGVRTASELPDTKYGSGPFCTVFALRAPDSNLAGKNLDWEIEDGVLVVNERGVAKQAWLPERGSGFQWVSRYGSVSFNQLGWGFPLGGMNEAGLVVEELSYAPSRYPPADARGALSEFQWIQYQLDNSASVTEVLESDDRVRVNRFLFGLHYFVADAAGNRAIIEFIDGNRVVHTGKDLVVPVLTNDTYSNLVRYLSRHAGFGGTRVVSSGPEAPERFVRAATMLQNHSDTAFQGSSVDFAFEVLDAVRQSDTQWSIVYDMNGRSVHYRSRSLPLIRSVELDTLDFSCRESDVVLPISNGVLEGAEEPARPWTSELNRGLVVPFFLGLEAFMGPEGIPGSSVLEELSAYPLSTRCAEEPQQGAEKPQ